MDSSEEEQWRVHACSSATEVHESCNVLKSELYRVWQTAEPTREAWLVLEARPPSAFCEIEIVNAGSALVEVFGLPVDSLHEDDDAYMMLLSAQQVMSTKDVINKANRNRSFTYTCADKLSQLAVQHKWKRIKVSCRQPFGLEEQKTSIGLARLSFKPCKTLEEVAADAAEAHMQQNLKAGLAKLFPKGSFDGCEVVSQVTEPSISTKACKVDGEAFESASPLVPRGKRRLPVWQSPSKQMKKGGEAVDAGYISNDEEEETGNDHRKKNLIPKARNSEKQKPVKNTSPPTKAPTVATNKQDKEALKSSQIRKDPQPHKSEGSSRLFSREPAKGSSPSSKKSSEPRKNEGFSTPSPRQGPPSASQKKSSEPREAKAISGPLQFPEVPSPLNLKRSEPHTSESSPRPGNVAFQILNQSQSSKEEPSKQENSRDIRCSKEQETKLPQSKSTERPSQCSSSVQKYRQTNETTLSFTNFLDGVIFALSGLVNPERAEIRDKALKMGGQYRPDWNSDCTLLVCAFANTPKFNQVKDDNGTIVSKAWILECYQRKELVEIEKFLMHAGTPWRKTEASVIDELHNESGESMVTLASLQEVRSWVHEDVASSMTWLKQQENQPKAEELQSVAIQGIQLCLDDAIECLKKKQSIKKILESWDFVPRAVQELSGREEKAGSRKKGSNHSDMVSEAERLKWIYSTELEKMTHTKGLTSKEHAKQTDVDDEDDVMTDVMSDDLSSDETQILDEEDIKVAEETLSKMLVCSR